MSQHRRLEVILIGWGLPLNLVWELAQSPLFADHVNGWRYVLWTRVHCTVGDVLILLGSYWGTAALFRSRRWPVTHGPGAAVVFVGSGFAYTVWSEWFNTTARNAWEYAVAMPRVLGIGLSPLLQWLLLPPLLIVVMRVRANRIGRIGRN